MSQIEQYNGAFMIWKWGDREIENFRILRKQLIEIHSKGFSGVLATLGTTRYEFIDRKVVRAVAQVSQWAKKRNIAFWFQTDPRQASRTFIARTGERTQNLIVSQKLKNGLSRHKLNIAKINQNRFELRYEIPRRRYSNRLREGSLQFEPCELEKTFLFQMEDGVILKNSIRDITSLSRFFTKIADGYAEVFGDVQIPQGEDWYCIAFPKFDTNLYDFAGRESNDLLLFYIEDLFDACAHLDGITWGGSEVGYVVDMGRFPVSLSIYNSFLAEYGYDLREVLYGLMLPVDDESHVKIRYDYYNLIMNIVFSAQRDFYQTIHSFFEGLDVGIHHTWHFEANQANDLVQGCIDPWQSLKKVSSTFIEMAKVKNPENQMDALIATLVIAKSLGVYSEAQRGFLNLWPKSGGKHELAYWIDLMGLFSVQWLAPLDDNTILIERKRSKDIKFWENCEDLNQRIDSIRKITRFRFPEANVALIFPIETIMSIGSQDAVGLIFSVNRLITKLTLEGIQCDVISPNLLKEGHISPEGFQIVRRTYDSIIFPYPEVLNPEVMEIIIKLDESGFPILFGGGIPRITSMGKRISHSFSPSFNPDDDDLTALMSRGVRPIFSIPENGLATLIYHGVEILLLLCPKKLGGNVMGEVHYREHAFNVPKHSTLVIFLLEKNGNVKQLL